MEEVKEFHPSRSKYLVFTSDYLLPLFICLGVLVLGYFVLYSPFFSITSIKCSLDFKECTDPNVIAELDKLKGQNIFKLNSSTVTTRLTSGDFTIQTATLHKILPVTIKLELVSVSPVVALKVKDVSVWAVMDSRFRVISVRDTDPNVPSIIVPGPLTVVVGQPPENELIIKTLTLAQKLVDESFTVKTITLVSEDMVELILPSGKRALFTPKKDELTQLRLLQVVLSDDTITKGGSTIDVRFDRPVLR
jgi:hypothetical protein